MSSSWVSQGVSDRETLHTEHWSCLCKFNKTIKEKKKTCYQNIGQFFFYFYCLSSTAGCILCMKGAIHTIWFDVTWNLCVLLTLQCAPARHSHGPSMASWGAATAVRPTGWNARWAVSEATGWRVLPDWRARPTPSGVDPNLGVWVSLI